MKEEGRRCALDLPPLFAWIVHTKKKGKERGRRVIVPKGFLALFFAKYRL